MRRWIGLIAAIALLTACAPQQEQVGASTTANAEVCTKDRLPTKQQGQLTIGVEFPTVAPWFIGQHPSNGQGFESALAYEIAKKLGFQRTQVVWKSQAFAEAISPTPKEWDVVINEFTITPERAEKADFSEPYYTNDQAIVVMAGNPQTEGENPSLADVQKLRLGAQEGTTSRTTADAVNPSSDTDVLVFDNHEDVLLALQDGKVGGMVTDAPTAQLIATQQVKGSKVYARLVPSDSQMAERFGIVLPKGSALTPCISWTIQQLWADRTIEGLHDMWLGEVSELPEVKLPRQVK